ncbi:hypothetical protein OHA21_32895 [Actinoplanes sp. NBC_00393]|uniref:hypothetical protein n=1 Tax=Actinoplanes sp. NBC_00393 TaxID=2975953 RepID=UPI002E201830
MSVPGRIGALVSGCALVLFAQACTSGSTGQPTAAPASAAPTSAAPASAAPASAPASASAQASAPASEGTAVPLRGGRQVLLALAGTGGKSLLTVAGTGIVELTEGENDQALFVPTPVRVGGDTYLIKTAKMQAGGEAWCLKVHSPGESQALRLKIAACDAGDRDQVFTFPAAEDKSGRLVEVAGLFAFAKAGDPDVVVEEAGEGGFPAFTVVDRGRATIPRLG